MLNSLLEAAAVAEARSGWKWIRLGPSCQSRIRANSGWLPIELSLRSGSQADLTPPKFNFRFTPESRLKTGIAPCPLRADTVAKVFLRGGTQILRPVGAAIEYDVGDHVAKAKLTGDSGIVFEALLIGDCRLFRLWRKISRSTFGTFATISANRRHAQDYSITSSAVASNLSGTVIPSALAVLRLITSSNLVGS